MEGILNPMIFIHMKMSYFSTKLVSVESMNTESGSCTCRQNEAVRSGADGAAQWFIETETRLEWQQKVKNTRESCEIISGLTAGCVCRRHTVCIQLSASRPAYVLIVVIRVVSSAGFVPVSFRPEVRRNLLSLRPETLAFRWQSSDKKIHLSEAATSRTPLCTRVQLLLDYCTWVELSLIFLLE